MKYSTKSPKNPYMVQINYDKALKEIGSGEIFTAMTIDELKNIASTRVSQCKTRATIRISHNEAEYPQVEWKEIERYFLDAEGNVDNRRRIGSRIIQLRDEKNMTQGDLAKASGVTLANISRMERGMYSPGLDVLTKIAEALGAQIDIV